MGIAVGIVMGLATVALVNSLVSNIIMPIITPFIPGGAWQTATLKLGPIVLGWGAFLAALLNFLIIAWVVFIIAKKFMQSKK
jgi:large conductance mechanosensitive channel